MFEEIERHKAEKSTPEAYPSGLERHVALKNGESILIRPIRPDDESRLVDEPSEDEATGEVALVLEDGYQGQGLGTVLLDAVIQAGTERGLKRFRAYVLAENRRMLSLLARHTRIIESKTKEGETALLFEPR